MTPETREAIQRRYRGSEFGLRAVFRGDPDGASRRYERYVSFVLANTGRRPAVILDIGCGTGWSTASLRRAGHRAFGTDLHADTPEIGQAGIQFAYVTADAQVLPFRSSTFDTVTMHEVLEHVPDPERLLEECLRILRPSGRLIVVGPHLLSIGVAFRGALRETWQVIRSRGHWPVRTPDMPRHPFGNTPAEAYAALAHHALQTFRKSFGESPVRFLMREPDPRPPFHSDNDACYYCNPMDLLLWAKQRTDVRPIRWWAADRRFGRVLWPVLGGTWIVLERTTPTRASY